MRGDAPTAVVRPRREGQSAKLLGDLP